MPGFTVPDGFQYETNGDVPGISLRAEAGTTLAEQLQTKFSGNDAAISDLAARVTALEDGTGGAGWIPIAAGSSTGSTFTIDLTDGGRFPSPPSWNVVNIYMRVDLDAVGDINCRVNNDSAAIYRSGSAMFDSSVPSNSDGDNWHFPATAQSWRIAHASTISTSNVALTLFHAHADPGLLSFQCTSARQSDDSSVHRHTTASGSLEQARTLTSLTFLPTDGASSFVNCWWQAVGLRMVHPG